MRLKYRAGHAGGTGMPSENARMTHATYNRVPPHLRHALAFSVPRTLSERIALEDVRKWLDANPAPKLTLPDAYQVEVER